MEEVLTQDTGPSAPRRKARWLKPDGTLDSALVSHLKSSECREGHDSWKLQGIQGPEMGQVLVLQTQGPSTANAALANQPTATQEGEGPAPLPPIAEQKESNSMMSLEPG